MTGSVRQLAGLKALVTGASSGLGAHFAEVLGKAGAHVVMAARRRTLLEEQAWYLRGKAIDVEVVELDVTDGKAVEAAFVALGPIDILVNNAGMVRSASALKQTEADWDAVIDVNLKGMFLVAQAAARQMRAVGKGGTIINVASILGVRQGKGVLPYAVSKAGVIQMTKALALELARHAIRVNALAPGYLSTDLNREFFETEAGREMIRRIPQRRLGELGDLDGPLLLLASDASAYMTGSVIAVDGGHLVSDL
ncbi:SDR family NAD(P)-dependent oxidoreductase [Flavisphingomonas formosensis]|uniref:SDR family NAD(P)-dependent oxidoreductase n=1 Tax=Flavisphingomonas formosensis TaxID=861534 RepID=UPI0012FA655F|nr:SDR family oxidoreductase [Sphingomonas formosensis]